MWSPSHLQQRLTTGERPTTNDQVGRRNTIYRDINFLTSVNNLRITTPRLVQPVSCGMNTFLCNPSTSLTVGVTLHRRTTDSAHTNRFRKMKRVTPTSFKLSNRAQEGSNPDLGIGCYARKRSEDHSLTTKKNQWPFYLQNDRCQYTLLPGTILMPSTHL